MLQNQPQRVAPTAGTGQLAQSAHEPGLARPETVQIRIEPFVPVVITGKKSEQSIFGGQIFLLRHVQIEDRHLLQGFQLNEEKLIEQVKDSARRFMREGMTFVLAQAAGETGGPGRLTGRTAYTAILGFGFGDLVLNLMEDDPGRIARQITQLRNWYIGITTMVVLAVTLALVSLWHNVRTQVHLSQQKDEFISAVSHELRTPLTSIRMYSEMLENNWVKSQEKLGEYYRTMRQESERLSRLIENVLDFSKIQKGKKKFAFNIGDINHCIADVVEMMRPYAAQHGFSITTYLGQVGQTSFDKDAVTQIVVNLLDNAIKYARVAGDKTITVRTAKQQQFTVIEVEDHGPGIAHRQRKKVFDQFYNYGAEVTGSGQRPTAPQSTGTGLGLTLVKKFAEAHNGFVEIVSAEPTGTIFRVGLAAKA
jgi:signal transduction histidine kinase